MSTYLDRFIIYFLSSCFIFNAVKLPADIIYLLSGLVVMGITCYLDNIEDKRFWRPVYILMLIAMMFIWKSISYMPLIMYGVFYKRDRKKIDTVVFFMLAAVNIAVFATMGAIAIFYKIILGGFTIIAVLLGMKQGNIEKNRVTIRRLRDDSTERNNLLLEKNRILSKNIDNEVRVATLSERNRIAREIHDNVGHMLSRSILQLGAIMTVNKGDKVCEQLYPLKDSLDQAMNSVRESVHDLHKESFDVNQAAEAILSELHDFQIKLRCDISENADKDIKYSFITILKEAVTNIEKYCDGDKVTVILDELEEHYQLVIEDNGTGNANIYHKEAGIGLSNMEDRIKALGGIITFSNNNGFRIFASVPKKSK